MEFDKLKTWEQLQKKLTWEQLGEFEGKTILEFGCGNGIMGAHYADRNSVTAIEPDEQVLADNPYENVKQICGNYKKLADFESESFDVILCHNVLEYAEERPDILKEFQRLIKPNGMISILKHNRPGRVMQMAVLLNNFEHVHELLDGHPGISPQYGEIRYYEDEELLQWAPELEMKKVLGMRTFWDLQQSHEIQTDANWQKQMMQLEQRVSEIDVYRNIAFFHHIILKKK